MRRAMVLVGIAAVIATATYAVRSWGPSAAAPSGGGLAPREVAEVATGAGGTGSAAAPGSVGGMREVDRLIAVFEEQVRHAPSAVDYTFLGELYLQRGRLTGDVGAYSRAEEALTRALGIYPEDPEARALLASVRLTTHDFTGARRLAEELLAEDPGDLGALAVAGDARLELGDYAGATSAYEDLARLLPGAAAVDVRRARLSVLLGDVGEARRLAVAAESSAEAAGLDGSDLSWYRCFRAQLELDAGRYRAASELYRSAVRIAPQYHLPRAGLGRALAAVGAVEAAIAQYRRAAELLPDPTYLAALGDLYSLSGRHDLAADQYDTVEAIATLAEVNRQVYNRQLAVFYADHDRSLGEALALAEGGLEVRRDVYGWDAYAWVLYRLGRFQEAREASDQALRLGTRDARMLYHAGVISLALGDEARAQTELEKALDISPAFDPIQAPAAERALSGLETG
jgi:tetratricopeptide (TPR) repeat protein